MANPFTLTLSVKQVSQSGVALAIILLMAGFFSGIEIFYYVAIAVALINMFRTGWFYPFAVVWQGVTGLVGSMLSGVILVAMFVLLLLPVALIRKMAGKDPMLLKQFKKSRDSVFKTRNYVYSGSDLENPY